MRSPLHTTIPRFVLPAARVRCDRAGIPLPFHPAELYSPTGPRRVLRCVVRWEWYAKDCIPYMAPKWAEAPVSPALATPPILWVPSADRLEAFSGPSSCCTPVRRLGLGMPFHEQLSVTRMKRLSCQATRRPHNILCPRGSGSLCSSTIVDR